MQINLGSRKINCKIVYYGPGFSGKTTNIQKVHDLMPSNRKSELTSIATEGDRTLFFDFMSLDLGQVMGMDTCFQLYTVPGQVYYNATRKLVLQGVDGLVFVADCSPERVEANVESWANLIENLADQMKGAGIDDVIICANDSDLYARFGLEVVGDLHPGSGPLGGVEAALGRSAGRADAVCFCPCDLPGMTSVQFARLMRAFAERPEDAGIVYAQTSDFFWHPLCALVHNDSLGSIRRALEGGTRSVRRLWAELRAVGVMFEDPTPFFNINTPDDMARWKEVTL